MNTIEDEDAGRPLGAQYSMDHLETFYLERPYASAYPDPEMDAAVSEHQKYALPTTTGYVDPFIAVKEMMWMLPGINEIVIDILNRMEKAFAYNSVYFLKVILDLQALYLPMRPPPESETMLDATLVLRIARVLSGRLARKNNDRASLSRELQLRTLISALSLLYQLSVGKLNSDSFAKLLRDVTEREADLEASRASDKGFGAGENEFLTRYACDLIRCLPSDLSGYRGCNREAIHFLFAAGFIVSKHICPNACIRCAYTPENQLEDEPSKQTIEAVFARVTAAPSLWHRDMHHLYEGAVGAISLYHQSKSEPPPKGSQYASTLAVEVARSILDNLELQLQALDEPSLPAGTPENQIDWDLNVDMYICGMLDLLSQLISAFPDSEDIARESKTLAIRLIRDSDKRAFRYKAVGYPEASGQRIVLSFF